MPTALGNRLDRLEKQAPFPRKRQRHCICVVASDADEAAAFARAQGFNADNEEDLMIIHQIVDGPHVAPYLARPWTGGAPNA